MLQIESAIVSVVWLHSNIEADNIVVLNATIPKVNAITSDTSIGYIPKSQFFDIQKKFSDTKAEFPNTVPKKSQFETEAQRLGINSDSAIILYDQHGMYSSSRAWWLFKHFGHNNVAVLNGGLPEWLNNGYKTIKTYKKQSIKGNFEAIIDKDRIIDYENLRHIIKSNKHLIVDARSAKRFSGEIPEPRKGLRSGTIPNSVNLPYTDLLNGTIIKSRKELKSIFDNLITVEKKLVFSCGSGITACNLALAAYISGYENISVYDGSWTEYGTLNPNAMNDNSNWSKRELIAYTLLYAAHSDFKENNHERNVIISKVDMQTFQKIHDEFSNDNDFQSIQKILASIEANNYSSENINQLLADIKVLFFADGDFDIKEHSMLLFLKRILK